MSPTSTVMKSAIDAFQKCSLRPITLDEAGKATTLTQAEDGTFQATSFCMDSSGRSNLWLPFEIVCETKADAEHIASCVPVAADDSKDTTSSEEGGDLIQLGFEVRGLDTTDYRAVIVESLSLTNTFVRENSIACILEVIVKSQIKNNQASSLNGLERSTSFDSSTGHGGKHVVGAFEVWALLTIQKRPPALSVAENSVDLHTLELGSIPDQMRSHGAPWRDQRRTEASVVHLAVTHALDLDVEEINGPNPGKTFVSLTLCHSNTHSSRVTVTGISLHPGHSTPALTSTQGGSDNYETVCNMTSEVQWKFAAGTEPSFPVVINPRDKIRAILEVDAIEDRKRRPIVSPLSVTAEIGSPNELVQTFGGNQWVPKRQRLVSSLSARYTTGPVASEPHDALRIEMTMPSWKCQLGHAFSLGLRVFNLGLSTMNLMLFLAREERKFQSPLEEAAGAAVVSEIGGNPFGIWGASPLDDGSTVLARDPVLLPIDSAIILGEVEGQHAVDTLIRFVPLRVGSMNIPNIKLFDKESGNWYVCEHSLGVVSS